MSFFLFLLDDTLNLGRNARRHSESFETLYDLYHQPIVRYLQQLCGSPDQAEELAQETFVKAYIGLLAFRGNCSAATWLYRIARNTYLNSLRRPHPARIDTTELHAIPDAVAAHDPARSYGDREERDRIAQVLAQLPEQHRSILLLRDAEGLAYIEIADVLGISVAAVRMKLFRARNMFRRLYIDLDATAGAHDVEL